MNKRAISPLVSTIILIVLAVGIGILVMNWGRAQLEAGAKCSIDTEMNIVTLNGIPQVCYSGSAENGFVKFILENGANTDIETIQIRIIGSKEVYLQELSDSAIEKGYTLQKIVPYNFDLFGGIRQVKLAPKIIIYPEEPSLLCPEQAIILENINPC
jgi:hypothetical protein